MSCPTVEDKENTSTHDQHQHFALRHTKSLNSSPDLQFKYGIPLGSLTAKLASKSFWGPDMLQKSIEQIAECAAKEVSCLGSSVESLSDSECQFPDCRESTDRESTDSGEEDLGTVFEALAEMGESSRQGRELRNPLRRESMADFRGHRTPPYLSPGTTRRAMSCSDSFQMDL